MSSSVHCPPWAATRRCLPSSHRGSVSTRVPSSSRRALRGGICGGHGLHATSRCRPPAVLRWVHELPDRPSAVPSRPGSAFSRGFPWSWWSWPCCWHSGWASAGGSWGCWGALARVRGGARPSHPGAARGRGRPVPPGQPELPLARGHRADDRHGRGLLGHHSWGLGFFLPDSTPEGVRSVFAHVAGDEYLENWDTGL
ncbi:hypothetical protein QJS66_18210 [Kocuria rhizophila]|nr:hypothetical protein QJS66_18210 [Kocuria rhizophila]